MDGNPHFSDMLRALNGEKVRYLIVGAYAVMYHSEPRYTKDLDLWIEPTPENAERVWTALKKFGAPLVNVTVADFQDPDAIYRIGREPDRIDFIMQIDPLRFADSWKRRCRAMIGETPAQFINLKDVLKAKRRAGRPQDLLDIARITKHKVRRRGKTATRRKRK